MPEKPKPPKGAVIALLDDVALAPEFDRKYGKDAAATVIRRTATDRLNEMTDDMETISAKLADLEDKIDEVLELVRAPRQQVLRDADDGKINGWSIPRTDHRVDWETGDWEHLDEETGKWRRITPK